MKHAHRILRQLLTVLQQAEDWHAAMLQHPLYRTAMRLLAGLLIGQLRSSTVKDWLWHMFQTMTGHHPAY